jgi:hypothetical protein
MLHVFSINRVKLAARKPKTTDKLGHRVYVPSEIMVQSQHHTLFRQKDGRHPFIVLSGLEEVV